MLNYDNELKQLTSSVDSFVLLLVNEKSIQDVTQKLSIQLGRAIIFEDCFFHILGKWPLDIIAFAFPKPQLNDPLIQEYVHKIHLEKTPLVLPPLPQYGVRQSRVVFPVMAGDTMYGYLHVFDKNNSPTLTSIERDYIKKTLTALVIKALKDEVETHAKNQIIYQFYHKLIVRQNTDIKIIEETADILRIDLGIPTWLMIAQVKGEGTNTDKLKGLESFIDEIIPCAKLFALHNGMFLILILEEAQAYKKPTIMSLAHQLVENFNRFHPYMSIYITFGRRCLQPADYHKSYREALKALDYLIECNAKTQVLSFPSLGIIGLVTLPEDVEQVLSFAQNLLAPLLTFDAQNSAMKLVQTLECFLRNNAQIKPTANELFIHFNTLRYRLEKIREISKLDLDNAEKKFEIFLALKILNLKKTLAR